MTHKQEPISVLLVDDRQENLVALEALLADMGLNLIRAHSGNEALRLSLRHNFALVLLDVQMPDMDGFETAELMRANPKTRHLPIIFVTAGMKDMTCQFKGYDAGAVDYLLKPLEPAILRSKVKVFKELFLQRCALEESEASLEALVEKRTAELVRTADHLLESEERYRNAFELAAVGIAHIGLDGLLIRVNVRLCDILGYARGELQQLTLERIACPEDAVCDQEDVQALRDGRISSYACEKRFVGKDGRIVLGHVAVALARDEDGAPMYFITVIEDITVRKQLEEQLRQSQKMEAIGQLAGGIAHDFNNLLSVIIGYANLAQMKLGADTPVKANVDQIVAAAEKASLLTRGLLAFSRKQEMRQQQVDLNELITTSAKLLKRVIGEDIQLDARLFNDRLCVSADSGQIDQVLMNLATNARDAMTSGGRFSIETSTLEMDMSFVALHGFGKPGKYAVVNVSDTGRGMDRETSLRIFDPFFTTKEAGKGTGLGLSIVYGIINQHNGFIHVYSEPGIGTTFRIYLPLLEMADAPEALSVLPPPRGGTETILLAEDDPVVCELEINILQNYGYNVMVARDGQEAVDLFTANHDSIDLVMLDMIMPRKNGSEAYMEIRRINPKAVVLFISGYTADMIEERGLNKDGVELLLKPVSPPDLARKLRSLLDNRQ